MHTFIHARARTHTHTQRGCNIIAGWWKVEGPIREQLRKGQETRHPFIYS